VMHAMFLVQLLFWLFSVKHIYVPCNVVYLQQDIKFSLEFFLLEFAVSFIFV